MYCQENSLDSLPGNGFLIPFLESLSFLGFAFPGIYSPRSEPPANHPMSWLAVTFTTQEINSLIPSVKL